ncbi:hypothetical protein VaNZ11_006582 [Volvox africanus]|uniref:Peptidase M11 gametolysin domain-containing protein n=1 Tax=Volvox africanus TaxID=51714 RepID=A0ABQ5S116_9CHLO|nr:hypothetical protein VaNZ11_006582 [Volvox africanus]
MVTELYMGPNGDGNGGVAEKFKKYSYGKFGIRYFQAAVVKPGCSTAITRGCSWWAIASGTTGPAVLSTVHVPHLRGSTRAAKCVSLGGYSTTAREESVAAVC